MRTLLVLGLLLVAASLATLTHLAPRGGAGLQTITTTTTATTVTTTTTQPPAQTPGSLVEALNAFAVDLY